MTRTMKKFTGFVLMVCMIVSLFAGVTTAFAAKEFKDVPGDNWAKPYVDFVVDKGYFAGATADLFKPDDNMTRGMFVAVIAKVEGLTLDNNVAVDFNDVQPGKYYAGAVKWATDNGIVSGYGNGNFGPNDAITREQICVMMDKYIQYHDANNKTKYLDRKASVDFKDAADVSSWAKESVDKCVSYGLIQGFPDGKFYPKRNATRAEVAVMIYRLALVKEIIDTDEYTVSYKYESATEGKTVPSAIPVPQDANKYRTGDIVTAQDTISTYYADGGVWTFKGWKENPITVQDKNIEFVGTWEWTASSNDKFSVSYIAKDSTSGLDITESVKKGLPADEKNKYKNGETVKAAEMPETIAVDKGTWEFVGFDEAGKEKTASAKIDGKDVVFTTYWKYTPKSDKFRVTYVAKVYGSDEDAPAALQARVPVDEKEYSNGEWLLTKSPTNTIDYSDPKGNMWVYRGNSRNLVRINGDDVVIYQYWGHRPANAKNVTYKYTEYTNSNNFEISILDKNNIDQTLPKDENGYYYGDEVTVMQPTQLSVPRRDLTGEWVFVGWDKYKPGDTFTMGWLGETINGAWKSYKYSSVVYKNDPSLDELNKQLYKDTNKYVPTDTVTVQEPAKKTIEVDGKTYKYVGAFITRNGKEKEIKGSFELEENDIINGKTTITWKWADANNYKVTYKFVDEKNREVTQKDLLKIKPEDEENVKNGETVIAKAIQESDWVKTLSGETWVWQGWDEDYKTVDNKDVVFVGKWAKTNTLIAQYSFKSTDLHSLDAAVVKQLPLPTLGIESGKKFNLENPKETVVNSSDGKGTWTFKGWKKATTAKDYITSDTITRSTTYYGYWEYKAKA